MLFLQHLNQPVQTLHHLTSAMVLDDEWHLEFRVLLQIVELPGMEIGYKVSIMFQRATHQPVVEPFRQIVK